MRLNKVKIKYSCAWNPVSNIDFRGKIVEPQKVYDFRGKIVEPQKVHSHSFFYDGQELIENAIEPRKDNLYFSLKHNTTPPLIFADNYPRLIETLDICRARNINPNNLLNGLECGVNIRIMDIRPSAYSYGAKVFIVEEIHIPPAQELYEIALSYGG